MYNQLHFSYLSYYVYLLVNYNGTYNMIYVKFGTISWQWKCCRVRGYSRCGYL